MRVLAKSLLTSAISVFFAGTIAKSETCKKHVDSNFPVYIVGFGSGEDVATAKKEAIVDLSLKISSDIYVNIETTQTEHNIDLEGLTLTRSEILGDGIETIDICTDGDSYYVVIGKKKSYILQDIKQQNTRRNRLIESHINDGAIARAHFNLFERKQSEEIKLWILAGAPLHLYPRFDFNSVEISDDEKVSVPRNLDISVPQELSGFDKSLSYRTLSSARNLILQRYFPVEKGSYSWTCKADKSPEHYGGVRCDVHCVMLRESQVIFRVSAKSISTIEEIDDIMVSTIERRLNKKLPSMPRLGP